MKKNKLKFILPVIISFIIIITGVVLLIVKNNNEKAVLKKQKDEFANLMFISNSSSLLSEQKDLENKYLEDFKKNKNTLDNPYIVTDPYKNSSLSALIMFRTENNTSGEVIVKGKGSAKDLVFTFEKSKEHFITVWGFYENYNNEVIIKTSTGDENKLNIDFTVNLTDNNNSYQYANIEKNLKRLDDFILLDTPIGTSITMIDTEGNIRARLGKSISKFIKQLDNGHILVSNGIIDREGTASGILEMDFSGKIYKYYNLDINMSYGSFVLENGNILYMAQNQNGLETFDTIVEINNKGEVERVIDIFDLMKQIDAEYMESIKDKWGYISGISYNKENNEIIVSMWYSSTIMGIDYSTGKINWIFTSPGYLSEKFQQYLLNPISEDFVYPKGPYSVKSSGDIFTIFATNWDLNESLSCNSIKEKISYFASYSINRKTKTISETWNYGKDMSYFSYALGSYNENNKYKTLMFGRELNNINYDEEGCMLNSYWDLYSKLYILENNEVIFEGKINGPNVIAEIYKINKKINNKFMDSKEYNRDYNGYKFEELKFSDYKTKIDNALVTNYSFSFKDNILQIIPNIENTNLILVSLENKIYKYSLTEYKGDKVFMLNSYNKYFKVYIEKDGEVHNTGTYLYI